MVIVTVARKPLLGSVAATVTAHGTGGLNIDGARIAGAKSWPSSKAYSPGFVAGGSKATTTTQDYPENFPARGLGRWPANFILQHLPGCCLKGAREASYSIQTWDNGAKPFGDGAGNPYTSKPQEPHLEDVWACAPGCPVKALDEESGFLHSNGNKNPWVRRPSHGAIQWLTGTIVTDSTPFDDGGGAARFFKQVKA